MHSYLVRIWAPATGEAVSDEVRGLVQRIGNDRPEPFVGVMQLLERLGLGGQGNEGNGDGSTAISSMREQ